MKTPDRSRTLPPARTASVLGFLALALALQASPAMAQVGAAQKISATAGGFTGALDPFDLFGWSTAPLGDLDGDGVEDVAVGSFLDDDGGSARGAVWILFLKSDGTVKSHAKISSTAGGFTGALDNGDFFGTSIAPLGDLDGDGVLDLAVGAYYDDDGGSDKGAVWILFLHPDGSVKGHSKISATSGGFTGTLASLDWFGWALTSLGDLDGDGVVDLAVAADGDDEGGPPGSDRGAVYVLFLKADGTVKSHSKIGVLSGGFGGGLLPSAYFGSALAALGDLDGDGLTELAVGCDGDDMPVPDAGSVWVLFLDAAGTVKSALRIGSMDGGFAAALDPGDQFGRAAASADLNGDGLPELLVGADRDDDGGIDRGAVWMLTIAPNGSVAMQSKISSSAGGFTGPLLDGDHFGNALAVLGDIDGNGFKDIAVGAEGSDDGGPEKGAAWALMFGPPLPQPYCFGTACPCGNDDSGAGCANSTGSGALLTWAGSTSVGADDLVLTATSVPAFKSGIVFMGGAAIGVPYGDGKLCVGSGASGIKRFPVQSSGAAGTLVQGPGMAAFTGLIAPGSKWHFQGWYRDPAGPCGAGINFSNALSAQFTP